MFVRLDGVGGVAGYLGAFRGRSLALIEVLSGEIKTLIWDCSEAEVVRVKNGGSSE